MSYGVSNSGRGGGGKEGKKREGRESYKFKFKSDLLSLLFMVLIGVYTLLF